MARLLVVDDDEFVRAALVLLLERQGYELRQAANGREATALCEKRIPDIVITDIVMPDIDGIELIRALRGRFATLKVIAISGGGRIGSGDLLSLASRAGADGVFAKPIDRGSFLACVSELLKAA